MWNKSLSYWLLIPGGKGRPVLWSRIWRGHTGLRWRWAEAAQAWLLLTRWSSQTAERRCQHPFCTGCESHECPHICRASRKSQVRSGSRSTGDMTIHDYVSSPTFLQLLPSTPRPRILEGSNTGMCGTDSQSERYSPLLLGPSLRSWCPGVELYSAFWHMEAQRWLLLYSWHLNQHFQGAWHPILHKTVWSANQW